MANNNDRNNRRNNKPSKENTTPTEEPKQEEPVAEPEETATEVPATEEPAKVEETEEEPKQEEVEETKTEEPTTPKQEGPTDSEIAEQARKEADKKAEEDAKKKEAEDKAKAKTEKNAQDAKEAIAKKVKYYLTEAKGRERSIALILESYNKAMHPKAAYNEKLMLGKQYELLSLYRDVFSVEDYGEFKKLFDVVNMFFNHYKKESLGGHYLSRFDYLWKWDKKELNTLLNVNEVIDQLSGYENRAIKLKQVNMQYALNPNDTIISEAARNNIIRYYSV